MAMAGTGSGSMMSWRDSMLSNAWLGYHEAQLAMLKETNGGLLRGYMRRFRKAHKDAQHHADLIARLEYPDHYTAEQRRGA